MIVHTYGLYHSPIHWIGLRGNLQETIVFTIKYKAFLQIFPSSNSMTHSLRLGPEIGTPTVEGNEADGCLYFDWAR